MTLETASPTFGLGVPTLDTWTLSVHQVPTIIKESDTSGFQDDAEPEAGRGVLLSSPKRRKPMVAESSDQPKLFHLALPVTSAGNISATFSVPGVITIPSDAAHHNVTIVRLKLDATMSWLSVPKKDAKTHLTVSIL